jgi:hypothetical protein
VGYGFGAVGMLGGAKLNYDRLTDTLHFTNMSTRIMPTAMSLGYAHVYGTDPQSFNRSENFVRVTQEESLHTEQANILGPFYLPAHALAMAISIMVSGHSHNANILEMGPESGRGPWWWQRNK